MFYSDKWLYGMVLNGKLHGTKQHKATRIVTLEPDQYISGFTIEGDRFVDYVEFKISDVTGRPVEHDTISAGEKKGLPSVTKQGVRVMKIGGRSKEFLTEISVEYEDEYKPSDIVAREVDVVFDFERSDFSKTIETTDSERYLEAVTKVEGWHISASRTTTASASVEGMTLEASMTVEGGYKNETTTRSEHETIRSKKSTTTTTIGSDEVGFLVGKADVMQVRGEGEEGFWMLVRRAPEWATIKKTDEKEIRKRLAGYFDLTNALELQTGLKHGPEKKYGYEVFA
jgi:hypothetical protein